MQVPFRDSTLTKLLADGLLSSAQTTMLACICPLASQLEQTAATLHFATVARRIATKPVMRLDPHDQVRPAQPVHPPALISLHTMSPSRMSSSGSAVESH